MGKNGSNMNGSGAGGNGDDDDKNKIVKFPTLADRDRIRKEKIQKEDAWRAEYKAKQKAMDKAANPPFLNVGKIPLFVKIIVPLMIAIHVVVHVPLSDLQIMQTYSMFGLVPQNLWSNFQPLAIITPISHMFIHGGWMHLIFNMIMLSAIGTFFSREFGDKVATLFFFLCGIGGAAFFLLLNFDSKLPLIGASGGISGFFGVLIIMMYKRGGFSQFKLVRKYGSLPIIGFWLAFMLTTALLLGGHSWEAHIGGFITGLCWLSWLLLGHFKFWKL